MATPDDLEEFRSCQQGCQWQRGRLERPVARRRTLDRGRRRGGRGHRPAASPSGVRTEDEGLFALQHRYWQEALLAALERERTQRVALREVAS